MTLFLVVATGVALAVLLWSTWQDRPRARWVAKPMASLGFLGVALASGALASGYGRAVLVAQVLCLAGDVLLLPKARRALRLGLFAFLAGHVAYGLAFLGRGVHGGAVAGALALEAGAGALFLRYLWPHLDEKMRGPVVAYVAVISGMLALAVGMGVATGRAWVPLAALAFYLSDMTVARHRFVREDPWNRMVGLPLYYGAQVALAWSVGL